MFIWLYAAIFGYFLSAISKVFDKILLAKAIPEPIVFTVFAGLLSGFVIVLTPFGFALVSGVTFIYAMAAGMCVLVALYFLYSALREYDASRVVPLVASIGPFITLLLSVQFIQGQYTKYELIAFVFLVVGGLLLSWNPRIAQKIQWSLLSKVLAAAVCMSGSYILTKLVFNSTPFLNGVIWTRFGIFFSALLLLLFARVREALRMMPRVKMSYSGFFVLNKVIGAFGLLSVDYAIKYGSPALVNALGSFEYFFVFLFAIVFTILAPRILREDISGRALALKLGGSAALSVSLFFLFYS
ncbi:MAG: DMT family transporter [Patescibacteria group bacterium]